MDNFETSNEELLNQKGVKEEKPTTVLDSNKPYLNLNYTGAFLLLAFFPITGGLGFHNLLLENGKRRFFAHLRIDIFFIIVYFLSFLPNLRVGHILSFGWLIEAFVILVAIFSCLISVIDGFRFLIKGESPSTQFQPQEPKKIDGLDIFTSVSLLIAALFIDYITICLIFGSGPMFVLSMLFPGICSIFALIILIKNMRVLLSGNKTILGKSRINLIALNIASSLSVLGLSFWILIGFCGFI